MEFKYTAFSLFMVLYAARLASAFPFYWYHPESFGLSEKPCDAHPTKPVQYCPHSGPFLDSGITFAFKDVDTSGYVDALCPGATYTINVTFTAEPTRRLALLTANTSRVTFTDPEPPTPECLNRVDLGSSEWVESKSSYLATFKVECSAKGLPVTFKVTSSEDENYHWLYNSLTLKVASGAESVKADSACSASVKKCGFNPSSFKWRAPGRYVVHWKPPSQTRSQTKSSPKRTLLMRG